MGFPADGMSSSFRSILALLRALGLDQKYRWAVDVKQAQISTQCLISCKVLGVSVVLHKYLSFGLISFKASTNLLA